MRQDTSYGRLADVEVMITLQDDGDFVFTVGGVGSSDSQNALFVRFGPLWFVKGLGLFVRREDVNLKVAKDAQVSVEGGFGESKGFLAELIGYAFFFELTPEVDLVLIDVAVNIQALLCAGVGIEFVKILGKR